MRTKHLPLISILVVSLLWTLAPPAQAQVGSAVTYQGRLTDAGTPVDDTADFEFRLFDAESGGNLVGTATMPAVPVADGLFTVDLDFGAGAFQGDARWLEIAVQLPGGGGWTTLAPRQPIRAAPYALYALDSAGGGASVWQQNGSDIYYDGGDVGIGTDSPDRPLTVEIHYDSNINPMAVFRTTGTNAAGAVRIENAAGNKFNLGITGSSDFALGYNANIGLSGDLLRVTPAGNFGIGTTSPDYRLHVYAGADAAIAGENPGEHTRGELGSAYGGVFGESTTGTGVWGQATAETGTNYGVRGECASPAGYAGYFDGRGYFSGNVGIGTTSPGSPLTVAGTIESTSGGFKFPDGTTQTTAASGSGSQWEGAGGGSDIYYLGQVGIGTTSPQYQLQVESSDAATIRVHNTSTVGEFCGVNAEVDSPDGRALKGYASSLTGDAAGVFGQSASPDGYGVYGRNLVGGYGVYGEGDTADGGWAGYFYGRGYFSGDVGIGRPAPEAKLDVNGTVKMTGLQLGTSSTSGYVLTCNSSGVGTWQAPTGGGSFDLPYAGTVNAHDQAAFSVTNTAPGSGGDPGTDTVAGFFESAALGGSAVTAHTTGGAARSVHAEADGSVGIAVYALANGSNGRAIDASNTSAQPTVQAGNDGTGDIYQGRHIGTTVFRVTYDGTTVTNVLQIEGGSDLSEQFDVQASQAEPQPGMVVCIDPDNPGKLVVSTKAYDRKVAGVISGAGGVLPGMTMGQHATVADGAHPVALTGRVYVWVDASGGAIEPGDLLTTSDVAGHARKVTDYERSRGATLGKAMTRLAEGRGLVLMLVQPQ